VTAAVQLRQLRYAACAQVTGGQHHSAHELWLLIMCTPLGPCCCWASRLVFPPSRHVTCALDLCHTVAWAEPGGGTPFSRGWGGEVPALGSALHWVGHAGCTSGSACSRVHTQGCEARQLCAGPRYRRWVRRRRLCSPGLPAGSHSGQAVRARAQCCLGTGDSRNLRI
jgi:hypothetical protein